MKSLIIILFLAIAYHSSSFGCDFVNVENAESLKYSKEVYYNSNSFKSEFDIYKAKRAFNKLDPLKKSLILSALSAVSYGEKSELGSNIANVDLIEINEYLYFDESDQSIKKAYHSVVRKLGVDYKKVVIANISELGVSLEPAYVSHGENIKLCK